MKAALVLVLAAGCTLEFEAAPQLTAAERAWIEAAPGLQQDCQACHGVEGIGFLAGDTIWEIRDSLLRSGMVNLAQPGMSRLFTKGLHEGTAMTVSEASALLTWIQAERDEQ